MLSFPMSVPFVVFCLWLFYHIQQLEPIFRLFHFRKLISPNKKGLPWLLGVKNWGYSNPTDNIWARSWTTFHGDGSWFCCGPDGTPLATLRIENFRDGLEDYAYALEYERRTGKKCEVPPEVCHSVWQFSDDPAAIYAWRDRIAEAIERE